MEIKTIKERLEGSYRLLRIRRIKIGFFVIQITLAIILGIFGGIFLGARSNPFYFPMDVFLFVFFLLLLFVAVEAIYFKGLEVRYTQSKSRKYLIAKSSIRNSLIVLALAIVCTTFLLLPFVQEDIARMNSQDSNGDLILSPNIPNNFTLQTQDGLGLSRVQQIVIESNNSQISVSKVFYNEEWIVVYGPTLETNVNIHLIPGVTSSMDIFIVSLSHTGAQNISYSWTTTSNISPFMSKFLPALGIAFIIVEMISISIMYPIREAHATSSIYSKKYVSKKDAGEYILEKPKVQEQTKEDMMLESTLNLEIPPPAPVAQVQAPVKREVARKKGVLDAGVSQEPDIPCAVCGEMNSPHTAMCYLCGNPLVKKAARAPDVRGILMKGVEFARAKKFRDAISCFDEVLRHDKANETALLEKGMALHKEGKWGQAIQYINTVLQINPANVMALLQKAEILGERDKQEKAIEVYSQVLALNPENTVAKSRMEAVSEEVAMEDAEAVLEEFMNIPGIGLGRATALYEAGFTSMVTLKAASEENLAKVKSISPKLAKKIKKHLESL
jgi:DNA uptake protein ComE-like DNA-binding protein